MTGTPHTSTVRGKKVRVVLKNGIVFFDKFWDKDGRFVYFKERGRVRRGEIQSFTIIRYPHINNIH